MPEKEEVSKQQEEGKVLGEQGVNSNAQLGEKPRTEEAIDLFRRALDLLNSASDVLTQGNPTRSSIRLQAILGQPHIDIPMRPIMEIPFEEGEVRGEVRAMIKELENTLKRMRRTQKDIDRLKDETRAVIARLRAA